jgi:phosphoesterase RecJ-like protein
MSRPLAEETALGLSQEAEAQTAESLAAGQCPAASQPTETRLGPWPTRSFLQELLKGRRVLVAGHLNPDGDSVGSSAALALALMAMGREVTVTTTGPLPASLGFLTRGRDFFAEVPFHDILPERFDRLVLVDCQSPYRIWPKSASPGDRPPLPMVAIDHHQSADPPVYEDAFLDPGASATCELVFKVLKALQAEFTPAIVEALLSGLVSDTGSFSQGNVTSETLRQAAELVAMGGDVERVNQELKQNWPLSRLTLMTLALSTLKLHHGGRLATMVVTDEMHRQAGSELSETEGLVEHTLVLSGVRLGALVKTNGHGKNRVSLRSRPGVDVRRIAQGFGGGGHAQAAAYLVDDPDPQAAIERLLEAAERALAEAGD